MIYVFFLMGEYRCCFWADGSLLFVDIFVRCEWMQKTIMYVDAEDDNVCE